jgi:hypothetical protein
MDLFILEYIKNELHCECQPKEKFMKYSSLGRGIWPDDVACSSQPDGWSVMLVEEKKRRPLRLACRAREGLVKKNTRRPLRLAFQAREGLVCDVGEKKYKTAPPSRVSSEGGAGVWCW